MWLSPVSGDLRALESGSLGVCCLPVSSGAEGLEVSRARLSPPGEEAPLGCATQLPGRRSGRASPGRCRPSPGGPAVIGGRGLRALTPYVSVQTTSALVLQT